MGLIIALDDHDSAAGELFWDDGDSRGIVSFFLFFFFFVCLLVCCVLLLPLTGFWIRFFFIKWKFLSFWVQKKDISQSLSVSSYVSTSWSCYTLLCNYASFVSKCCDKDKALCVLLFTDTVKNSNYIHYKFTVTQVTFPHKFIHPFFQIEPKYFFQSELKSKVQNHPRILTFSFHFTTHGWPMLGC